MAHKQLSRSSSSRIRAQDCSEMLNSILVPHHHHDEPTHRIFREEQRDLITSLQEQLIEKDLHISRLQEALSFEREKCARLQSRCVQQGAELKRREQHIVRMREKLSQLSDRLKPRGVCEMRSTARSYDTAMEIINVLPKRTGRRETGFKPAKADGRTEEALRLLLDRREAELREAMKLRHALTTLLHTLRDQMAQTLQEDSAELRDEDKNNVLVQSEQCLGDHVTGGVVQEWMQVQKRLQELVCQSPVCQGTDQEKLLAHVEEELEQSRELIRAQQQLLQDSVAPPLPAVLTDCYYLEEWERLQDRWEELNRQRRSFQRERQAFTEAAIRLGHERSEFEQQKASRLKSEFLLSISPVVKSCQWNRRESTALDLRAAAPDQLSLSPCTTPSPEGSEVRPGSCRSVVMTPNTPELFSALKLSYRRSERMLQSPDEHSDWPF